MTTEHVKLVPTKYIESTQTAQYTSPQVVSKTVRTVIDKCTVVNSSAASVEFSLNTVNGGDVPGAGNLLIIEQPVEPGVSYDCPEVVGQVLEEGQLISTLATASSALILRICGRQITT